MSNFIVSVSRTYFSLNNWKIPPEFEEVSVSATGL